jgi:hypothetical protein
VSFTVQGLPSSQAAVLFTFLQPSTASHESSVQGLPSSQLSVPPGVHVPETQVSLVEHAFPFEHEPPSLADCFEQAPVEGSQMPALHWSADEEQSTSAVETHVPGWSPAHA